MNPKKHMSNLTYEDNAQNEEFQNDILDAIDDESNQNIANRSAYVGVTGHDELGHSTESPGKPADAVSIKGGNTIWTPQHAAFLDQHIFLGKDAEATATFNHINDQLLDLSEGYQNFRIYPAEFKTVGYHLNETREGCYRIQLFEYNNKLGVNCTRLDGDSLALGSLWSKLKTSLHENGFYVDKFLAEMEEEDNIFDDEDDDDEDMDAFKYLDFSRDEAFVRKLVDDVLDFNVGTHALMLLKFNFQKEKNLQLVADKFSQDLFNNTIERLNLQHSTLPATICASHIIKDLVERAELSVTAEQVNNMATAAERLCAEKEEPRTIVPTASEEASHLLLESIPQATDKVSDKGELDIQEELTRISTLTSFDRVRDSAEALIESN